MELGGGAKRDGAIVRSLDGECVILPLFSVEEGCSADRSCVAVDSEIPAVVLT